MKNKDGLLFRFHSDPALYSSVRIRLDLDPNPHWQYGSESCCPEMGTVNINIFLYLFLHRLLSLTFPKNVFFNYLPYVCIFLLINVKKENCKKVTITVLAKTGSGAGSGSRSPLTKMDKTEDLDQVHQTL
jgi:hypothetical protein